MRYLVDTNVISEAVKKKPRAAVIHWMEQNARSLFLSSITIEELRFGQLMMAKGKKRNALGSWIDSLSDTFAQKIVSFDARAAEACAVFHERAISNGRTPSIEDLMIAGIAEANGMVVATRNTKDFDHLGIDVVDPFEEG